MCCLLCSFCLWSVVKKEHRVCGCRMSEGRVASLSKLIDRVLKLFSRSIVLFQYTHPNPAKFAFLVEPVRD